MVEDYVDLSSICYPFDFAGYVLSMMVENKICSKFLSFVSLSLAPNRSNNFRVQEFSNLDSRTPNTTTCRPHQNRFPWHQTCPSHHHMPSCQVIERNCGCLFEAEVIGDWKNICSRNRHIFSIAALSLVSDDPVRLAQAVPSVAAIIADSTAYSRCDQNLLRIRMFNNETSNLGDFP